jgi:hypothetical protein
MTTPKTKPTRRAAAAEAPRLKRAAKRASAPVASAGAAHDAGAQAGETKQPDPSASTSAAPQGPSGKLGIVVALMRRPEGATVAQMMEATDWQAHSVRGAMAGSLKRKHKLTITGTAGEGGKVYRIAGAEA